MLGILGHGVREHLPLRSVRDRSQQHLQLRWVRDRSQQLLQ
jgi:hypothetical protein